MKDIANPIDRALLDDWQRDFPVVPRPFAELAKAQDTTEADVLSRLEDMLNSGRITRVGATCAPNTLSASTLAAVAAPDGQIEKVAEIINEDPGVNHSYEREDKWNIWFVATGPDRDALDRRSVGARRVVSSALPGRSSDARHAAAPDRRRHR